MNPPKKKLPPPPPVTASPLKGEDAIFIPIDGPVFYTWFDSCDDTFPREIRSLFISFRRNLEGVSAAAFMPVLVGVGFNMKKRLDELHHEEKTARGLKKEEDSPEALQTARAKFEKEIDDPVQRDTWTSEAIDSMGYLYKSKQYEHAAFELLRQSTVLSWLAIENLVRDSFQLLLKLRPALIAELVKEENDLVKDEHLRKQFATANLTPEMMSRPDFDVSKILSVVSATLNTPAAIETMKSIYRVLLPKAAQLQSLLRRHELLILNQRYHLITHRGGIVDQSYLDATHDHSNLNEDLAVSSQAVREYLSIVRDVGIEILKGLADRLAK
jgi:hypothetical protein